MIKRLLNQLLVSFTDNPKSAIQNRKWGGVVTLVIAFVMCGAVAQAQPGKIFRIGFLDSSTASGSAVLVEAFRQGLGKLGWVEGKNISTEYRSAEKKGIERLPELAAELVRLKVDLIVAVGTPSALAAKIVTCFARSLSARIQNKIYPFTRILD